MKVIDFFYKYKSKNCQDCSFFFNFKKCLLNNNFFNDIIGKNEKNTTKMFKMW